MSRLSLSVLAELNGVIFSEANSLFSGWQVLIIFVSVQASSSSLIAPQWRINGSLLFSFVTPSPLIPLYKGESPFFVFDFSQNFFWFLEHSLQKWEKRCWSSLSARFALTTESQLVSSHTWLLLLFTPRSPPPQKKKGFCNFISCKIQVLTSVRWHANAVMTASRGCTWNDMITRKIERP